LTNSKFMLKGQKGLKH